MQAFLNLQLTRAVGLQVNLHQIQLAGVVRLQYTVELDAHSTYGLVSRSSNMPAEHTDSHSLHDDHPRNRTHLHDDFRFEVPSDCPPCPGFQEVVVWRALEEEGAHHHMELPLLHESSADTGWAQTG